VSPFGVLLSVPVVMVVVVVRAHLL